MTKAELKDELDQLIADYKFAIAGTKKTLAGWAQSYKTDPWSCLYHRDHVYEAAARLDILKSLVDSLNELKARKDGNL